jgi:cell wall-associated NlpC family hydrolase
MGPSYNLKPFMAVIWISWFLPLWKHREYQIGGTTKEGFDCSGLMMYHFWYFWYPLPRTSIEQSRFGVQVNNEQAQKEI